MGLHIDEEELADFGWYMGAEGSLTLPTIETLAIEEGLNPDGFKGAMAPLGEICTGPAAEGVRTAFRLMREALCNLGDGLIEAAEHYGYTEDENVSVLERTQNWYCGDYKRYLPESAKEPYR